jgi:DNA-3-methyladenine glycosylase II
MPHIDHLSRDKKFKKILEQQERYVLSKRKNIHLHLCNSIMSQQLSTKVADVFQTV